jgi:hypothetical protein
MICSPISWHLRGGLERVGAARGQFLHLLRPHHHQRAGDGCSAEQRRANGLDPAHGLVQSLQLQVKGEKIQGNFKLNVSYVTTSLNLLSAALYWDIYSPVAHVGQLVVAGLQH